MGLACSKMQDSCDTGASNSSQPRQAAYSHRRPPAPRASPPHASNPPSSPTQPALPSRAPFPRRSRGFLPTLRRHYSHLQRLPQAPAAAPPEARGWRSRARMDMWVQSRGVSDGKLSAVIGVSWCRSRPACPASAPPSASYTPPSSPHPQRQPCRRCTQPIFQHTSKAPTEAAAPSAMS